MPSWSESTRKARLTAEAQEVDAATGGLLTRLVQREEISGKSGKVTTLLAPPGVRAGQVVVVGLGEREKFGRGEAFRAAAAAAKKLAEKKRERVGFYLGEGWTEQQVESGVCGAMVGCRGQDLYRAEKDSHPFEEILWDDAYESVLQSGQILGETVNLIRQLVNEPPSRLYPVAFAAEARKFAEEYGLKIEVWDEQRLETGTLRFAVGRGPRFRQAAAAGDRRTPRRGADAPRAGLGRQGRDVRLRRAVAEDRRTA